MVITETPPARSPPSTRSSAAARFFQPDHRHCPADLRPDKIQGRALHSASAVLAGRCDVQASIGAANDGTARSPPGEIDGHDHREKPGDGRRAPASGHRPDALEAKPPGDVAATWPTTKKAFTALGVPHPRRFGALPAGKSWPPVNKQLAQMKKTASNRTSPACRSTAKPGENCAVSLKLTEEQMAAAEKRAKALGLVIGPEAAARPDVQGSPRKDLPAWSRKSLEIQIGEAPCPQYGQNGYVHEHARCRARRNFSLALKPCPLPCAPDPRAHGHGRRPGCALAALAARALSAT